MHDFQSRVWTCGYVISGYVITISEHVHQHLSPRTLSWSTQQKQPPPKKTPQQPLDAPTTHALHIKKILKHHQFPSFEWLRFVGGLLCKFSSWCTVFAFCSNSTVSQLVTVEFAEVAVSNKERNSGNADEYSIAADMEIRSLIRLPV